MDCLRSFSFRVDTNTNLTTGIKQWTTSAGNHFFSVTAGSTSTYNIQGFKNINVFGVDCVGSIQTQSAAGTGGVIINDWSIDFLIFGQQPLVGGSITTSPNFYGISADSPSNNSFSLSRFNNSVKLASPIQSVKFVQLGSTYATGWGYQTLNDINLYWNLDFIVYYKFEGE